MLNFLKDAPLNTVWATYAQVVSLCELVPKEESKYNEMRNVAGRQQTELQLYVDLHKLPAGYWWGGRGATLMLFVLPWIIVGFVSVVGGVIVFRWGRKAIAEYKIYFMLKVAIPHHKTVPSLTLH